MLKTKKKMIKKSEITDVICNKCGKSCFDSHKENLHFVELKVSWGWGSKKDLEHHLSHICESCYDKLIETFKIKPEIESNY